MPAEPPREPWWLARRVLAGAVAIVLVAAGATYAIALGEVHNVVEALGQTRAVRVSSNVLAPSAKGEPQTLLLVGNDKRPAPRDNPFGAVPPHSNEMLLVRIDPSKPTISMLSIPRELRVSFTAPDGRLITNRINSAFTFGGINLMLKTIEGLLGISINHVFVASFPSFRHAVDEMGCVYMMVDRRYYHHNEAGGEQYFEINLQPGYQRLCGNEALEFVANRHEDTSLVRDSRDQRFLLEAKTQYGPTLFENRERFERILGKAVEETDLHGTDEVLNLLELLVGAANKPVRQVPFHVTLLPFEDLATPEQLHEAARSFMNGTGALSARALRSAVHGARPHGRTRRAAAAPAPSLTPTSAEELQRARSRSPSLPFPIEYPTERVAYASARRDLLHLYDLADPEGHEHQSYVISIDRGGLGETYDVEGTSWSSPPLLDAPAETITVGRRAYQLYFSGEHLKTVAWSEDGARYWIENTLTNSIQPREMLAMAELSKPVIGGLSASAATSIPHDLAPPSHAVGDSAAALVATGFGLVSLGLLGALGVYALARRRELLELREQVAYALAVEARQRLVLGEGRRAHGAPQSAPPAQETTVSNALTEGEQQPRPAGSV